MSVFSSILWVTCRVKRDKSDALVVSPGREPVDGVPAGQHPALRTAPEPHVVALRRTAGDLLLVREVLLAVEQSQRADRRLVRNCAGSGSR